MRVLFAALFVFVGLLAGVAIYSSLLPKNPPTWLVGMVMVPFYFALLFAAFYLFNRPEARHIRAVDPNQFIKDLEERELLVEQSFNALRAFAVKEYEDEGSHYFVELADGGVLFLSGQYLYDYEPIEDDPDVKQPRQFPCTEFTVRRHKTEGYVVEIAHTGTVLEPECLAPHFNKKDFKQGLVYEDGQIVRDKTYDQVKRERMHG